MGGVQTWRGDWRIVRAWAIPNPMPGLLLLAHIALGADTIDDLLGSYGDLGQADHRFLIEADEASADPEQVASLLAEAARSLPEGDRIEVIAIGATPELRVPPRVLDEGDREPLAAELAALTWADPGAIDIGAALGLMVDELRNEAPTRMQFVYVYGDLCHEPPAGSPWAFEGTTGCRQLRGSSRLAEPLDLRSDAGLLRAFALVVGRADPDGLRATLRTLNGRRASKDAIVSADKVELERWMQQRADRVRTDQLALRVVDEANRLKLVVSEVSADGAAATLRVHSGLQHLSLRLDHLTVTGAGVNLVNKKASLEPDGEVMLRLELPEAPFALWPQSRPLRYEGTLSGMGTLDPRLALGQMGVRAGRGRLTVDFAVDVQQPYGLPWAATVGLGALLALVLAGLRRLVAHRFS